MCDSIQYNTSSYTFQEATKDLEENGMYDFNGFGLELPDDLNKLFGIRLCWRNYYSLRTESSVAMATDEAIKRWNALAPKAEIPIHLPPQIAVLFAEAIWLDTLADCYDDSDAEMNSDFEYALYLETIHKVPSCPSYPSWEELAKSAHEAGVDSRIDSWLSGVPLEDILAA